jgi:DNA (cytosine-5)-methyltransferase 1
MSAKWSKGTAGPAGDEHHNLIACQVAHALRGEGFDASEDGTGRGTPIVPFCFSAKDHGADAMSDLSPTLRAGGHAGSHANAGVMPAVAFAHQGGGTQTRLGYDPDSGTVQTLGACQTPAIAGSAVRRLTPRECERLQGFPDDYTLIPWRKGMAPDGPRYKALGNSMCTNVMAHIGRRIAAVEAIAQQQREAA